VEALVLMASGFLGAILGSWMQVGLWENNQPPSHEVLAFVREAHRAVPPGRIRGWLAKRILDVSLAAIGLALAAPWAVLMAAAIWWQDPGPVLFVKNSTTTRGRNFRQWKLRTMIRDAEQETGPIVAAQTDRRVLPLGRFLRKTALDELPQLVNVLLGEMSIVGPRPQRTILVAAYVTDLPEYPQRHAVPPGLAGLAQVAGDYYLTPRQKLRYDRLYIRHASLSLDLQLLAAAFVLVFWYRWRPGWNGRLPRHWIRWSMSEERVNV
jgi:lipopolysaccharide/colanic/teichoic acid biosynthesis glycosyltransferase